MHPTWCMAEGQGFEPWNLLRGYTHSKRAPSTTRPSLQPLQVSTCGQDSRPPITFLLQKKLLLLLTTPTQTAAQRLAPECSTNTRCEQSKRRVRAPECYAAEFCVQNVCPLKSNEHHNELYETNGPCNSI